jgi:D-3-phosphoglycerate dehydrogenase
MARGLRGADRAPEVAVQTVVIAYGERADALPETELLEAAGYEVRHLAGIPDAPGTELSDAGALMVTTQPVTDAMLAAMPRCRIVARVGTGLDRIDVDAAARRGIYVTNVADYSVDEVSAHAIMLLLAYARRLREYQALVTGGGWSSTGGGPIRRLRGQTLGVAGFGRIGRATAAKARGLGLRVIAFDPLLPAEDIRTADAEPVGWAGLLAESDYLSLHVPLTPQSRHMINADALAAMKPSAVLINTARGGLVDETALADAIRSGTIAGAALDVLTDEPPPAGHPLLSDERVLITPHSGWYSLEAQRDVVAGACEDVHRVLSGQPPRSPVNTPLLPAVERAP